MKELSQKISVVCLSELLSDPRWTGVWSASQLLAHARNYHADPFSLEPQPVEGTGGECYELTMEHSIDRVDAKPFVNPASAVVLYKVSGREEYVIVGTRELPATVQIVKDLNRCILKVSCSMLRSPF